jgi:hypothetical protein
MRLLIFLAALTAGSALAQEPTLDYEPTEAAVKNIRAAYDALGKVQSRQLAMERADGAAPKARVTKLGWRNRRLLISYEEPGAAPAAVEYETLAKIGAVKEGGFLSTRWGVPLPGGWTLWCENNEPELCGKALADYFYFYRYRVRQLREADRQFAEAVAKYKDPATRPPLPEDVRKFKIQAEFAVDNKKLDDAINYYTQGVIGARWWADGYFNLALLLAEKKDFVEAIRVMKRFIALQEGTPDARRALDMTYRWEAMVPADQRE